MIPTLTIRQAIIKDITSIKSIWLENYDDFKESINPEELEFYLLTQIIRQDDNYKFWVGVNENEEIIAWSSVFPFHPGPMPFVKGKLAENSTYVKKEYRNRGVGKNILKHALEYCVTTDIQYVKGLICSDNIGSLKMCMDLGFEKIYSINKQNMLPSFEVLLFKVAH